jgi:catechol 2,3-dioxygenase-like lactoylglutathione lyase family enzyme
MMGRLYSILAVAILAIAPAAQAQIYTPNEMGVSLGQWHLISPDVEATKKFWAVLGGKPIQIDGTAVMKFPGVLVFIDKGTPTGGSVGTGINHVGFGVPNVVDMVMRLEGAGYKVARLGNSPLNGQHVSQLANPDGVEVEITEEAGVDPYPKLPDGVPIESNHIHFSFGPVTDAGRVEMQAWYVKMFGAKPRPLGKELTGDIPGVKFMRFGFPSEAIVPTKGRAVDHLGFEVKNLEAFCKTLESKGVKLTAPYSKTRHKSFASAELVDPWGITIELTEGLNKF